MEIVSTQIPHIFRNRFLRDGDSFMMTTNSGGGSGGSSGTFAPHYVWGQYEDGQTDIVGDFVTSADASIGGNVQIDSSLKVSGNLRVANNASVGKLYVDTSLFVGGQEISMSKYVRNDVTTEQTIKGNLRLKGSGNYGNRLFFGDGTYCYIGEETDDHLTIKATNLSLTANKSGVRFNSGSVYNNGTIDVMVGSSYVSAYNYTPTFEVSTYTSKSVTNLGESHYCRQLNADSDRGICIVSKVAVSGGTKQDSYILLPPTTNLQVGYTARVINNTVGSDAGNVILTCDAAAYPSGETVPNTQIHYNIIDSSRNLQVSLPVTSDIEVIYTGTYWR